MKARAWNAKMIWKNRIVQMEVHVFVTITYATVYALLSVKRGNTLNPAQAKYLSAFHATRHARHVLARMKTRD